MSKLTVIKSLLLSLLAVLLVATPVLAAYRAAFVITEDNGTAYEMFGAMVDADNEWMADNDFMDADARDTRVETLGGLIKPHMVATDKTLTSVPISANSQTNLYFTTGNTSADMDIITGYRGKVKFADDADLELADEFEIDIADVYINTDEGSGKKLIYKSGAVGLSVTDDEEISGIIYYDEPLEFVPGGFAAWQDIDMTGYVPASATGVVVHLYATAGAKDAGVRINGSASTLKYDLERHGWAMVGIDGSDIFEVYLQDATVHCLVVGFTGADFTYKAAPDDISIVALAAWTDIDCSVEAPGATGIIVCIINVDIAAKHWGLRMNGSGDNRFDDTVPSGISWAFIGCDSSQIIEGYIEDADVHFYVMGYTTSTDVVFNTNADDISLGGAAAWTDIDCSSLVDASATHVIIEVISAAGGSYGLRCNGHAEDLYYAGTNHFWAVVACDSEKIIEGKISALNVDFYLIGWFDGRIDNIYQSVVTAINVTTGEHDVTLSADGVDFEISVDGAVAGDLYDTVALGGASVDDNGNNWFFMDNTFVDWMPYAGYLKISTAVGGYSLKLHYQPNDMIANTGEAGTADAGTAVSLDDAILTQANDYWIGARLIIVTTTDTFAPQGETAVITDFDAANDRLIFDTLTAVVDAGDTYTVDFGTLPDRATAGVDGRITWGYMPDGVAATLGGMVSSSQPVPGLEEDDVVPDILPDIEVSDWFVEPAVAGSLLTNPLRPFVTILSDSTTLTELQAWRILGLAFVLFVTVAAAAAVRSHLLIAGIAAGASIGACCALTIFPLWTLVFAVGAVAGGLVAERSPSL